jgi:hypothetical protein
MTLIGLVITLLIVGLLLWLINTYVPMQPTIKNILNIVVIIFVIIWLIQALGLLGPLGNIRVR